MIEQYIVRELKEDIKLLIRKVTDIEKKLEEAHPSKEEYNSGNVDFLKEGKYILCSKCLDNTPHIPAWGICQRCGTQYTTSLKV